MRDEENTLACYMRQPSRALRQLVVELADFVDAVCDCVSAVSGGQFTAAGVEAVRARNAAHEAKFKGIEAAPAARRPR